MDRTFRRLHDEGSVESQAADSQRKTKLSFDIERMSQRIYKESPDGAPGFGIDAMASSEVMLGFAAKIRNGNLWINKATLVTRATNENFVEKTLMIKFIEKREPT